MDHRYSGSGGDLGEVQATEACGGGGGGGGGGALTLNPVQTALSQMNEWPFRSV